ncbi:uncharacterized protein LOC110450537 isoform X2 [Mizuhopecten yessoensis]|uniref:uncharacterized protein LOC110450537 isoform X2 n=1 Tax=Mizuhopecten yessoensis TaxID=6573 RepID=UPI000B45F1BE|nr:uncharacterized protein LOC110450537 isoform X2 [Mizuhopecten yessoensis]
MLACTHQEPDQLTAVMSNNFVEEELQSVLVSDENGPIPMEADRKSRSAKEAISGAVGGIRDDSRRLYKFVKKHIHLRRKEKFTAVKNIHIEPEYDETTWARRSASSAASRSSVDSALSTDSNTSSIRDSSLEIVHDMENDFGLEIINT